MTFVVILEEWVGIREWNMYVFKAVIMEVLREDSFLLMFIDQSTI